MVGGVVSATVIKVEFIAQLFNESHATTEALITLPALTFIVMFWLSQIEESVVV
jgi:hypothetical protein